MSLTVIPGTHQLRPIADGRPGAGRGSPISALSEPLGEAAPTVVIRDLAGNDDGVVEVMGPGVVHFDIVDSLPGDGELRHCLIEWDFGDPNGRYNELRGFNAAHFYDVEPGSAQDFTVTVTITNRQLQSAQATRTVRVLPNTRTVVTVGSSGADFETAAAAWSGTAGGDIEFRFAEGETFDWTSAFSGGSRPNILIRSTTKGEKFNINVDDTGTILSGSENGGIRDAHFVDSEGGSDPSCRILDSIDNGWAIDITSDDDFVNPGFLRSSRTGMLFMDVQTHDFVESAFKAAITPDGTHMVVLGCDVTHEADPGERPMRGFGQKWLVWNTKLTTHVKDALAVQGDEQEDTYVYIGGDSELRHFNGGPLAIGHSSSGAVDRVTQVVVERTLLISTGGSAGSGITIGQNRQAAAKVVVRNCILSGGYIYLNQSEVLSEGYLTEDVEVYSTTVIYDDPPGSINRHVRINSHYDRVQFQNILGVGWVSGSSVETLNFSHPDNDWQFKHSVMPEVPGDEDVRGAISGQHISYAQLESEFPTKATGNITKDITLDASFRPANISDPDLVRERPLNMAAFAEDYYGNPRSGTQWIVGAVGEEV